MNRIFLLLELLHHRPQAKEILADLIDEEGDPALAELVRSRKKADKKLMQLALEVTPFRLGTQLGIDYFLHATSFGLTAPELDSQLGSLRAWIGEVDADDDPASDERRSIIDELNRQDVSVMSRLLSGQSHVYALGESYTSLIELITVAGLILDSQREQDFERLRRRTNRHRNALVSVSKYCRLLPRTLIYQTRPATMRPYSMNYDADQQMKLQWKQLIGLLKRACDEGTAY